MHAGITPRYRGVHGGYWALAEQRMDLCGVTIHLVDSGIDTGSILAQATIRPTGDDDFATYPLLQLAAGLPLLLDSVERLGRGDRRTIAPPTTESALRYHPRASEYLWSRWKLGVR
jgi:methionyl-tRNA formyltransferase